MKLLLKVIRFVVCSLLIYFIFKQIDYEPLREIVKNIRIQYCLLIIALLFVQYLIKAIKWHLLLVTKKIDLSIFKILRVDYASTFLSLFVPSSISLDLFRGYSLSREVTSKKIAASSIIVDRAIGLFALTVMANLSVLLFYKNINLPQLTYTVFSVLLFSIASIILLNSKLVSQYFERFQDFISGHRLLQKLDELRKSIYEYKFHRTVLLKVFLLSLTMQMCRIFVYFCSASAVNASIEFQYFMIFTPVIMFIVMLPISFAGLGLREGSFVFFFSKIDVLPETAFAISAIVSVMLVISLLPGGLIIAFKGFALKKDTLTINESLL